jgi:tRNA-2-methylthio-N6-dimethylallyladenosine synthase
VPPHAVAAGDVPRPGDVVQVEVTYGAPHHLVADAALAGGPYTLRRTRAGDAFQARQQQPQTSGVRPVGLGLPSVGAPAPSPVVQGCR